MCFRNYFSVSADEFCGSSKVTFSIAIESSAKNLAIVAKKAPQNIL
jgi:hypothetical protein